MRSVYHTVTSITLIAAWTLLLLPALQPRGWRVAGVDIHAIGPTPASDSSAANTASDLTTDTTPAPPVTPHLPPTPISHTHSSTYGAHDVHSDPMSLRDAESTEPRVDSFLQQQTVSSLRASLREHTTATSMDTSTTTSTLMSRAHYRPENPCPNNCCDHGSCDHETATCECETKWQEPDCCDPSPDWFPQIGSTNQWHPGQLPKPKPETPATGNNFVGDHHDPGIQETLPGGLVARSTKYGKNGAPAP
eukprot:GFYU01011027.1.p1 GENE.GFYU01011027.1~~GFYU01011027.1.p1  ORF type:complete len:249 (+),score=42.16 GFYU01011027.1:30-776(+)